MFGKMGIDATVGVPVVTEAPTSCTVVETSVVSEHVQRPGLEYGPSELSE